ncbi:MAG: 2-oxoisovalerate dehydrogenase, partial [Myxococcales bacterium]
RMYRSAMEIEAMTGGDPVERLASRAIAEGWLCPTTLQELRSSTFEEVREAYARVEREPAPAAEAVEEHLFGPQRSSYPPVPIRDTATTMLRATNETLHAALAQNPRTILFGEDIEDPKGGVFGITKGLSNDYPGRVVNSPLAEATIAGMAVGLAAVGWRPIFELQFVDFVGPALNQLMAQVSNLRWRTRGEWSCPMVLYAPCGAYLPSGGMWHSQSNEGLFAAIPGLRVGVPSTPEDAAGLLWTATHDEDPSLLLLPKHLLRAESGAASPDTPPVRWGVGRIVQPGTDVTVVAWGNCVEIASAAADLLEGASVEIVDPRTLVPCDWKLIAESVGKT